MELIPKPIFDKAPEDDIFKEIKNEVQQLVASNRKYYYQNIIKAVIFCLLFLSSYTGILYFGNHTFWLFFFRIFLGISIILIFINTFHDAAHEALFKNRKWNLAFCYTPEVFGSNHFIWTKRHIPLHHPYPNIPNRNIGIKQSDITRIFPNSPWLPIHKYQHIYMWFLYPMYTLNWLFLSDFKDLFREKDHYLRRVLTIPKMEYIKLLAAKLFTIFYTIILPLLLLPQQPWYHILLVWIVMHIMASTLGTIALLSTHVDENAHFQETDAEGHLNQTWFMHQLDTTKDFSADSRFAHLLFGGFTNHVAHPLFPELTHTAYPQVTKIIRRYAKKYHLPYYCYPFYAAVRSHFRLLKKNGKEHNLFQTGEL